MSLGDVAISRHDSIVVAQLTGEIDVSNAAGIEEAITLATPNDAAAVVIDLSNLEFVDSSGIQLVYRLREQLQIRGQDLKLVIPAGAPAATRVPAVRRTQAGQDILVARCPHCSTVAALSGPGKHLCRGCHKWLEYEVAG